VIFWFSSPSWDLSLTLSKERGPEDFRSC
jgi:hypothetical protein